MAVVHKPCMLKGITGHVRSAAGSAREKDTSLWPVVQSTFWRSPQKKASLREEPRRQHISKICNVEEDQNSSAAGQAVELHLLPDSV